MRRPGRATHSLERGRVIEELAGTVLQHVQTAAMAVDDDGRVGVYNPAAAGILGVEVDAVVGRDLEALATAPPALAALAAILREARRSGRAATRRQIEAPTPAGARTLGYTVSILGEGGAAALFFADITDALAEERRAAEAQRFAEVGQIASAMAHELKSPLATVELYANLLRRALADQPAAMHQLDVIKDQTRHCLERIRAIMHSINPDAARVGGTALTQMQPLVRAVVAEQRRRHGGSVITLRGACGDSRVALGENDLRSVVGNLVVNALEVSGGKGPVDITLRADADKVHLRVADKGSGLPDGDVFAAFYSTKSSGAGLGLWLVRRLVAEAGGGIGARDRRGGGAVFEVELPLPRHERLRGADLLVVEDDEPLRAASVAALEACGAGVTAVGAGKDVPHGSHTWECAILDYHLPDLTGVQVAARLPAGTPILMVSGDPAAGAALAEVRERRAWYLPKPFAVETYLDLVSLLVGST
ncbi:MAG: hybrid sensor histidine kinase/response regulator [Actinomycetes bacterium]